MSKHISVLLNVAIDMLDVKENGFYFDGTLGRGGHSEQILKRLKGGKLYCFDLDSVAIAESKERLSAYQNVEYRREVDGKQSESCHTAKHKHEHYYIKRSFR